MTIKQNCASVVLLNECEDVASRQTTLTSSVSPSSDSLKDEAATENNQDNSSMMSEIEDSLASSKKSSQPSVSPPGMLKGKKLVKKLKITSKKSRNNNNDKKEAASLNYKSCCVEHMFSFGLFLIYCLLRSMFIYEIFIVFKYSRDLLFVVSIVFELVTIFVWMLSLAMLACKKDWSFKLDAEFKLLYWNWLYYNYGTNDSNESSRLG